MSNEESPQLLQTRTFMTELREIEEFIALMDFTKQDNSLAAVWKYGEDKKINLIFRKSAENIVRVEMNGVVVPLAKACQEFMLEKFEEEFPSVSLVQLRSP